MAAESHVAMPLEEYEKENIEPRTGRVNGHVLRRIRKSALTADSPSALLRRLYARKFPSGEQLGSPKPLLPTSTEARTGQFTIYEDAVDSDEDASDSDEDTVDSDADAMELDEDASDSNPTRSDGRDAHSMMIPAAHTPTASVSNVNNVAGTPLGTSTESIRDAQLMTESRADGVSIKTAVNRLPLSLLYGDSMSIATSLESPITSSARETSESVPATTIDSDVGIQRELQSASNTTVTLPAEEKLGNPRSKRKRAASVDGESDGDGELQAANTRSKRRKGHGATANQYHHSEEG